MISEIKSIRLIKFMYFVGIDIFMFCSFRYVAKELENVIKPKAIIEIINIGWWLFISISVKPIKAEDNPPNPLKIAII